MIPSVAPKSATEVIATEATASEVIANQVCLDWAKSPTSTIDDAMVERFQTIAAASTPAPGAILVLPIIVALASLLPLTNKKYWDGYRDVLDSILQKYKLSFCFIQDQEGRFAVTNDFIVLTSALAHKLQDVASSEKMRAAAGQLERRNSVELNAEFSVIIRIYTRLPTENPIAVLDSYGASDTTSPQTPSPEIAASRYGHKSHRLPLCSHTCAPPLFTHVCAAGSRSITLSTFSTARTSRRPRRVPRR